MALSALLLLLPLLLNQNIPDESVQLDLNAVYSGISSLEQWKDPRNSLASLDSQLTEPQRALAKMHWELETIQKEKPKAPPQFDLGLFSEALEAMVEMDEEAKKVRLRKYKLIEWAGGEAPEVRVNENGKIEVSNGPGGNGRMEVKRRRDEQGNEQVVITFVKKGETEGSAKGAEENPQKELKKEEPKTESNAQGGLKTDTANYAKSEAPKAPATVEEKEGDAFAEANGRKKADGKEELFLIVADNIENAKSENDGPYEIAKRGPKSEGDTASGGWFNAPFSFNNEQSPAELFFSIFGRKKRDTVATEYQRAIHSIENLSTLGKPGSEFTAEKANSAKGNEKQNGSNSEKTEDEKKAAIKEYMVKGAESAEGNKKEEKLAYVWYSELLYWTAKWIEALENRVRGVNPKLAQRFLFSKTGVAAYKELKDEVEKCELKLAKLKEWVGDYFK